MKIYAVNGSPRKNHNTAILLQQALAGAKKACPAKEIQTEILHLYDLQYTGCRSCFACKRLGSPSYGSCAVNDDLKPVLQKLAQADAIIFGSPIFFGSITGQMKALLERLLFPFLVYDATYSSIAPKKMPTAFIYTMNVPAAKMAKMGYPATFNRIESYIGRILSRPLSLQANDTYQFDDYSKYKADGFSAAEKAKQRETVFPIDCQKAFALGEQLLHPQR